MTSLRKDGGEMLRIGNGRTDDFTSSACTPSDIAVKITGRAMAIRIRLTPNIWKGVQTSSHILRFCQRLSSSDHRMVSVAAQETSFLLSFSGFPGNNVGPAGIRRHRIPTILDSSDETASAFSLSFPTCFTRGEFHDQFTRSLTPRFH